MNPQLINAMLGYLSRQPRTIESDNLFGALSEAIKTAPKKEDLPVEDTVK